MVPQFDAPWVITRGTRRQSPSNEQDGRPKWPMRCLNGRKTACRHPSYCWILHPACHIDTAGGGRVCVRGAVNHPVPAAVVPPPTRDPGGPDRTRVFWLSRAGAGSRPRAAADAARVRSGRAASRFAPPELGMPSDEWIARARTYADASPERAQYPRDGHTRRSPPDPLRGLRDDLLVETQIRNRIQQQLASVVSWYSRPADRLALRPSSGAISSSR